MFTRGPGIWRVSAFFSLIIVSVSRLIKTTDSLFKGVFSVKLTAFTFGTQRSGTVIINATSADRNFFILTPLLMHNNLITIL